MLHCYVIDGLSYLIEDWKVERQRRIDGVFWSPHSRIVGLRYYRPTFPSCTPEKEFKIEFSNTNI